MKSKKLRLKLRNNKTSKLKQKGGEDILPSAETNTSNITEEDFKKEIKNEPKKSIITPLLTDNDINDDLEILINGSNYNFKDLKKDSLGFLYDKNDKEIGKLLPSITEKQKKFLSKIEDKNKNEELLLNNNIESDEEENQEIEENQENKEENQEEETEESNIYVPFKTEQFKGVEKCCPCESDDENEIILDEDDIDDEKERLIAEEKELEEQVDARKVMGDMLPILKKRTEHIAENENILANVVSSLTEEEKPYNGGSII